MQQPVFLIFQMERHHVTESVGNRDAVLSNELHSATEFHSLMDQPIFYLSLFLSLFFFWSEYVTD